MTSALRPTGSTRRWRQLRAPFARHLTDVGPLPCRRCGEPITAAMRWHLGHPDHAPRALGGNDTDLWPEHDDCSTKAGARLGNHLRRLYAAGRSPDTMTTPPPSRDW